MSSKAKKPVDPFVEPKIDSLLDVVDQLHAASSNAQRLRIWAMQGIEDDDGDAVVCAVHMMGDYLDQIQVIKSAIQDKFLSKVTA